MPNKINRRRFLGGSIIAGTAAVGLHGLEEKILASALAEGADKKPAAAEPSAGDMPTGKIGDLTISRLISGGNLISGWCHARDLIYVSKLAEAYLTGEKQFDTLELLEEKGVNSIVLDMMQTGIVNQYKDERGGKIQALVAIRQDWGNWGKPEWNSLKTEIDKAIEDGPSALFVHGGYADRLVRSSKSENMDLIAKAIEYIREQKFPAGIGAHALEVPVECDKRGIKPDFHFKTFHHDKYWSATPKDRRKRYCVDGELQADHNEFHDNIFCIDPEETIAFMKKLETPWIAFKVLAAGAIDPGSGFKYAFENGVDFAAVGMFDFQVVEDALMVKKVLGEELKRERPWRA